jgi:hypothetical protein
MPRPLRSWLIVGSLMLMPGAASAEETHAYPECTREPTEAYELYGQKHQAVLALETYLQRKPDAGQRDQIEKRIEVLNTQIAREPAQPAEQAKPTKPVPAARQQPVGEEQSAETAAGRRSIVPLIVVGAGGAIAIAGGVLFLKGKSDQSKVSDTCPQHQCSGATAAALVDKGNSANTKVNLGGGLAIGGLAVAAGGLIWYFVSKPSAPAAAKALPRRPHAQLTPSVSHEFAGLSLTGSF